LSGCTAPPIPLRQKPIDANRRFVDVAMTPHFNIAVGALIAHVLRSGDLRFEFTGGGRALEGIRAHQRIQRQRPADYQAELPVRLDIERPEFTLCVSGRIDGVYQPKGRVTIEEIKTTQRPLAEVEAAPSALHWGQAQCYAYMYARQENLPQIDVQLTYVHLDSGHVLEVVRVWEFEALAAFFNDLLDRYVQWVQQLAQWARTRDHSIAQLPFPFDGYRPGQRDMAVEVFRTIRDGRHLLVQAATGIGKTMAALYPALKALGQRLVPKVVFLTARTTGRLAAEVALQTLSQNGLRLKWVTLTAKEKICFTPGHTCSPEECPYAKGHYDRLNAALDVAWQHDALNRETIEKVAEEHRVCPFEFSLELVTWADCVIGDYNYAFDPTVTLRRLFGEEGGAHAVLVDEAHNLVDRSREMFSAQLNRQPITTLRAKLKNELPTLHRALGRVHAWMGTLRRRCLQLQAPLIENTAPEELSKRLLAFTTAAERWLRRNLPSEFREELLQCYFDCLAFARVTEQYNHTYATIAEAHGKDVQIKLFCMDPSEQLRDCWRHCHAAVLFSATLTPGDYFQSILGCHPDALNLRLATPFPSDNLAVFIASRISTFYRQRESSCLALSDAVADLVMQRRGHYLLFFPSYEYLAMIHRRFSQDHGHIATLVQTPDMTEEARMDFLAHFTEQVACTLVGFAVMGGIFGEGIDLKGDRLAGAVIVGVGLPAISTERELIRAYYDRTQCCGFAFAYQYPGINRVLQAAGRVIRSEMDRGVVLLIDQRYAQRQYRALLPETWQPRTIGDEPSYKDSLARFWAVDANRPLSDDLPEKRT